MSCADESDAGRGESPGSSVRNIFHAMGSKAGTALTRSLSGLSSDTTWNRSKTKIMPSVSPGSGARNRSFRSYKTLSHQASRDTAVQMVRACIGYGVYLNVRACVAAAAD